MRRGLRAQAKIATSPALRAAGELATSECKKILRRISKADAAEKREKKRPVPLNARLMAKLSHAAPLAVFTQILAQVPLPQSRLGHCRQDASHLNACAITFPRA